MKELGPHEIDLISGADFKGMVWGAMDGAATGMAIGGKWAGAGGWGWGALSQLVGITVPTIMGGAMGAAVGLIYNTETVAKVAAHYRETFGPGNVGRSAV